MYPSYATPTLPPPIDESGVVGTDTKRRVEYIASQRVLIEEQLKQLLLSEKTLLLELIRDGADLTPIVVHDHILVLSCDPVGSQHVVKLLQDNAFSTSECEPLLLEIINVASSLMVDVNGCIVLLKFLDIANDSHIDLLLRAIVHDMYLVCVSLTGSNCVQRMVDRFSMQPMLRSLLTSNLRGRILDLIKDLHGSRVVMRCLERWSNPDNQFIYIALLGHCRELSCHNYSYSILQKSLEKATTQQRNVLSNEILGQNPNDLLSLIRHPYGNYIVQYLLDLNIPTFTEQCARKVLHSVSSLACNKFSSNVVERCFRVAAPETFQLMLDEILEPSVLPDIAKDQFGNYVLQTAVSLCNAKQLEVAREMLGPFMRSLKYTTCGRKLQAHFSGNNTESDNNARIQKKKSGAKSRQTQRNAMRSNDPEVPSDEEEKDAESLRPPLPFL